MWSKDAVSTRRLPEKNRLEAGDFGDDGLPLKQWEILFSKIREHELG